MRHYLTTLFFIILAGSALGAEPRSPLSYVPENATFVLHLDVATIYDTLLRDDLKKEKKNFAQDFVKKFTDIYAVSPDQAQSLTLVDLPARKGQASQVKIGIFRKKIDLSNIRKQFDKPELKSVVEVVEKDGFLRLNPKGKAIPPTVFDLRQEDRVIEYINVDPADFEKPFDNQGVHAKAIKDGANAAIVFSINFDAYPDTFRDGKSAPGFLRNYAGLRNMSSAVVLGKMTKTEFTFQLQGTSRSERIVDFSIGDLRSMIQQMDDMFIQLKKTFELDDRAKLEMLWFDRISLALREAEFERNGKNFSTEIVFPMRKSIVPFLTLLSNGMGADKLITKNNLKILALGTLNYESVYGYVPSAAGANKSTSDQLSWRVHILPYLEQDLLYRQFKLDEAWDSEHNLKVMKDNPMPRTFALPGSKNLDEKKTHYQVFSGKGAIFDPKAKVSLNTVKDGSSNTILFVMAKEAVEWTKPDSIEFDPNADLKSLLLFDEQGQTFLTMADASVKVFKKTNKEATLKAMITRAGREILDFTEDK